jgi:hypothetical protein
MGIANLDGIDKDYIDDENNYNYNDNDY